MSHSLRAFDSSKNLLLILTTILTRKRRKYFIFQIRRTKKNLFKNSEYIMDKE